MTETPNPNDLARAFIEQWQQQWSAMMAQSAAPNAFSAGFPPAYAPPFQPSFGSPFQPSSPFMSAAHDAAPSRAAPAAASLEPLMHKLDELARRLDSLTERVDALTQPRPRPSGRKATAAGAAPAATRRAAATKRSS